MLNETEAVTEDGRYHVRVIGEKAAQVVASIPFQNWLNTFDHESMALLLVVIQSADIVCDGRVLFVKFEADVEDRKTHQRLPGITFMRGDAVTILTIVTCIETGKRYILLTKQPRVCVGQYRFQASPAGITSDSDDTFDVRALGELAEETGIELPKLSDLHRLGWMTPSEGGCDERLQCYWTHVRMHEAAIVEISDRVHGVDGEQISIELVTVEELIERIVNGNITDAKLMSSLFLAMAWYNPEAILVTATRLVALSDRT